MKTGEVFRREAWAAAALLVERGLDDVVLCFDYRILPSGQPGGANAFNISFFTLTARQIVDGVEKKELPLER